MKYNYPLLPEDTEEIQYLLNNPDSLEYSHGVLYYSALLIGAVFIIVALCTVAFAIYEGEVSLILGSIFPITIGAFIIAFAMSFPSEKQEEALKAKIIELSQESLQDEEKYSDFRRDISRYFASKNIDLDRNCETAAQGKEEYLSKRTDGMGDVIILGNKFPYQYVNDTILCTNEKTLPLAHDIQFVDNSGNAVKMSYSATISDNQNYLTFNFNEMK